MSVILGRKIGLENLSGGGKTPPEEWAYLAHKIDGGTWEWNWPAPKSGWYSIHLIGDGGGGCKGADAYRGGDPAYAGAGGGGGGHGAYAIHQVRLKSGETVKFVRTESAITATIGEAVITVTHGGSGKAGTKGRSSSPGSGGAGGIASGANTLNLNGGAGNLGNSPGKMSYSGGSVVANGSNISASGDVPGGSGGIAGTITAQKYSSGKADTYTASAPNLDLGNAGTGGMGGDAGYTTSWNPNAGDEGESSYVMNSYAYTGKAGQAGKTGGVVIDCAAS